LKKNWMLLIMWKIQWLTFWKPQWTVLCRWWIHRKKQRTKWTVKPRKRLETYSSQRGHRITCIRSCSSSIAMLGTRTKAPESTTSPPPHSRITLSMTAATVGGSPSVAIPICC
jgi:hypothetical protein